MRKKIPEETSGKRHRRAGIRFTVLCALAALGIAACFPGGASGVWDRVFSFFGLRNFSACADSAPCSVHILDVGKADSILIQCDGKSILVDGGTADRGTDVVSYLKRRGIQTLELVVNTHPDSDHIGGLEKILRKFTVRRYWAPDIPKELIPSTDEYQNVQTALKQKNLKTEHPAAEETASLDRLNIQVLGPVCAGSSTNNNSIVLKLSYGNSQFLLMGDAEKEEEKTLLEAGCDLSADVLKVGHHGSATSTARELLDAVNPRYAAVSVGNDSNRLPKLSVLKRLFDIGTTVYRTDVDGTIIFLTDGKSIWVRTEKQPDS